MDKIYIFGHRNPDTDSVTSAIALEHLKRSLGFNAEARILGEMNDETKYVLNRFQIKCPKYLNDVKLQIKDIGYHKGLYQDDHASIEDVYSYMNEQHVTGVPIVDSRHHFLSIVTAKMILQEVFQADMNLLYTSYDNILETLSGSAVLRFDDEIVGNVTAVSYKSTTFLENFEFSQNDVLIVGDRHSIIEAAVMKKVKLLIITGNGMVKEEHIQIAKENHVNVIRTPFDTFKAVRKVMLSNYARVLYHGERQYTVSENDYYDDFISDASELGFNNYPVVDKNQVCKGMIRITDMNEKHKKKVILVDHNESEQSVVGLEEAEILEVIDHHRIGDISTSNPINFRNMAVGSTNTIVYYLYQENRVEIPKVIASIMLAGILSDTLSLTSPTTTEKDRLVKEKLEKISGLDSYVFSQEMFSATANIEGKSELDLITSDMKTFQNNGRTFKVSQIITMDSFNILKRKEKLIEELNRLQESTQSDFVLLMITEITGNCSYLLYNESSLTIHTLQRIFNQEIYQGMYLKKIVSRKKQMIPLLMEVD